MEIPIEKIFAYSMLKNPTKEQTEQQFEIMKNISWQDFENLSKQELEKIPVGWIYDWEKITGTNHSQKQIENLYKKHNIKTFPLHQYQTKFSRPIPPHDDVNQILIVPELRYYIHTFLIYNNDFIEDVSEFVWDMQDGKPLIEMSIEQKRQYFDAIIGKNSKTYILKFLTLKHLSNLLIKNSNVFLPTFWRCKLKEAIKKEERKKEYAKQIQKILLEKIPNLTIEDVLKIPVEKFFDYPIENDKNFEKSKNKVVETITTKFFEDKPFPKNKSIQPLSQQQQQTEIDIIMSKSKISISTLQRIFYISFNKAASIMDDLVDKQIVQKVDIGYKIIEKVKLKQVLENLLALYK